MSKRPSSHEQARNQVKHYMHHHLTGCNRKVKKKKKALYATIIEAIWHRDKVGIYSLKEKHVRWYLEVGTSNLSSSTRYRHWLSVREILIELDVFEHWKPKLRGPWENPEGRINKSPPSKAGRKPKYC